MSPARGGRVLFFPMKVSLMRKRPWAIAHRGASLEAPENTVAAFRRAVELGADLIELDVHQTADGHVVVIHDETVDRTTNGSGFVQRMTLRELRRLDAGSWMGSDFAGVQVPTLREVLELTRGQAGLAIEIKAGSTRYPGIETTIVRLLQATGRMDDVILISDDCRAITQVRQIDTHLATACFRHGSPRRWHWYRRLGLSRRWHSNYLFVWPERLSASAVNDVHRGGLGIVTSLEREPVADPVEIRRLARMGVDGIIADDVGLLVRVLAEMSLSVCGGKST